MVLCEYPQTNLSVSSFDRCNVYRDPHLIYAFCLNESLTGSGVPACIVLPPLPIPSLVTVVLCSQNKISIQIIQQMKQEIPD